MLTIMCGFPGSGKSTYLETIVMSQPNDKDGPGIVVLCPDEFRLVLTGKDFHQEAENSVSSHVKIAARVLLLRGHHVIIDEINLTVENRNGWICIANDLHINIYCLWQNTPFEVSLKRNRERYRIVPDAVMNQMRNTFVPPSVSEGFISVDKLIIPA